MTKIAVYTAIIGGYTNLAEVKVIGDADYICFTDQEIPAPHPWQLRIQERPHPDPRFASRYYFDQSTLVLPEYEYTIMHSGNAVLAVKPESLLMYLEKTDIASFKHPFRLNVYHEPFAIAAAKKDTMENMAPQMIRYHRDGFMGKQISACTILIRRNTPLIQEFEKKWWHEVLNGSHRDQLSFDYIRFKMGFKITRLPGSVFRTPIMERHRHVR
jgi:hypothetical protein